MHEWVGNAFQSLLCWSERTRLPSAFSGRSQCGDANYLLGQRCKTLTLLDRAKEADLVLRFFDRFLERVDLLAELSDSVRLHQDPSLTVLKSLGMSFASCMLELCARRLKSARGRRTKKEKKEEHF